MGFYYKRFGSFVEGFRELQLVCKPAADSVGQALNTVPLLKDIRVKLGELDSSLDAIVKFALVNQASQANDQCEYVYAKANHKGFVYRTNSKLVFGWKKWKRGITFAVILPKANLGSKLAGHVAMITGNLRQSGWSEAHTQHERAEFHQFTLVK